MIKEDLEKIKVDDDLYQTYLEHRRKSNREYWRKRLADPEERQKVYEYNKEKRELYNNDPVKRKTHQERRKRYYESGGKEKAYQRTRKQVFRRLCKNVNREYKDNKITCKDLRRIAKKQKCKCFLTGIHLTIDNMSVDHIIPKSKGGLNVPDNIRLTIKEVNVARQNMTDDEFYNLCKLVVEHRMPSAGSGGTPP